jgi:hypothetical protein
VIENYEQELFILTDKSQASYYRTLLTEIDSLSPQRTAVLEKEYKNKIPSGSLPSVNLVPPNLNDSKNKHVSHKGHLPHIPHPHVTHTTSQSISVISHNITPFPEPQFKKEPLVRPIPVPKSFFTSSVTSFSSDSQFKSRPSWLVASASASPLTGSTSVGLIRNNPFGSTKAEIQGLMMKPKNVSKSPLTEKTAQQQKEKSITIEVRTVTTFKYSYTMEIGSDTKEKIPFLFQSFAADNGPLYEHSGGNKTGKGLSQLKEDDIFYINRLADPQYISPFKSTSCNFSELCSTFSHSSAGSFVSPSVLSSGDLSCHASLPIHPRLIRILIWDAMQSDISNSYIKNASFSSDGSGSEVVDRGIRSGPLLSTYLFVVCPRSHAVDRNIKIFRELGKRYDSMVLYIYIYILIYTYIHIYIGFLFLFC